MSTIGLVTAWLNHVLNNGLKKLKGLSIIAPWKKENLFEPSSWLEYDKI